MNSKTKEDYEKNLFQSYLRQESFKRNTDKYLITGIINIRYKNSDVIFYKKHFLNGELEYEVFYNFDGELRNGKESVYHDNGNLMAEFNYKDGIYNGINKHYYENGGLSFEQPYLNGKLHGNYIKYSNSGEKITINYYEFGKEINKID